MVPNAAADGKADTEDKRPDRQNVTPDGQAKDAEADTVTPVEGSDKSRETLIAETAEALRTVCDKGLRATHHITTTGEGMLIWSSGNPLGANVVAPGEADAEGKRPDRPDVYDDGQATHESACNV